MDLSTAELRSWTLSAGLRILQWHPKFHVHCWRASVWKSARCQLMTTWKGDDELNILDLQGCERWLSCFLILAIHVHINIELWALKTRYLWMFWHNFLEKVIFVWSDVEWDQPLQSPLQLLWNITDSQITTSVHPPSSNLQGPLLTWQRSNSTWGKESSDKALVMIWYNHPELQCCTLDALNLDWIYL